MLRDDYMICYLIEAFVAFVIVRIFEKDAESRIWLKFVVIVRW